MLAESFGDLSFRFRRPGPQSRLFVGDWARFALRHSKDGYGETAEQLRREHIALEGDTHGKNKWAILFTVLIMTFMSCLDSTVVTVALPVMQKELGVGLDRIQLVSSVYLLATCVAMLPFGRLGDVRGKVGVFQLGVIVFTAGSLLCGLSSSLEVLILARIVQGVGCAAAMANNWGIITESFFRRANEACHGVFSRPLWPSA